MTAKEYVLLELERNPIQHIMTLVEGFSEMRQKEKSIKESRHVQSTLRGYSSAINNAIETLISDGKIRIIDLWYVAKGGIK